MMWLYDGEGRGRSIGMLHFIEVVGGVCMSVQNAGVGSLEIVYLINDFTNEMERLRVLTYIHKLRPLLSFPSFCHHCRGCPPPL